MRPEGEEARGQRAPGVEGSGDGRSTKRRRGRPRCNQGHDFAFEEDLDPTDAPEPWGAVVQGLAEELTAWIALAERVVSLPEHAEYDIADVVDDAYVRLLEHARSHPCGPVPENMGAWFRRVIISAARDRSRHHRRARRSARITLYGEVAEKALRSRPAAHGSPEDYIERVTAGERIWQAICRLPSREREAILRAFASPGAREGISTIEARMPARREEHDPLAMRRAKRHLREMLRDLAPRAAGAHAPRPPPKAFPE